MKFSSRPYLITSLLLLAAVLLSVAVGSVFIPLPVMAQLVLSRLQGQAAPKALEQFGTILFSLRLPRTVLMALVGAGLAGSGTAYQGLFRNPLADPYLIGVSSGAGLGAVLAMAPGTSSQSVFGLMTIPVAAFAGAVLTVVAVYQLARVGHTLPTTNLILAGVAVSAFTSALTSYLMLTSTGELRRAIIFLMGGATMSGWQPVLAVLPFTLVGLGVLLTTGHALNVFQFGEEQAAQLGLPVGRLRRIVVLSASLTTAAAISFAGVIGFVGLVVPHLVRFLWGGDYRRILPLSIIGGAALLLYADVLARVVLAPQELPVGIITALVGVPFFLWILRRARQQAFW
jgi:iron complex transport system permease protein